VKSIKRPVVILIAVLILAFSVVQIFGISTYYGDNTSVWVKSVNDIRWGIDIRGGVDVTFAPHPDYTGTVTNEDIDAARSTLETRMIQRNITDYEVYTDYNNQRIIVRFPWQASDMLLDPDKAVMELGEMSELTFRFGDAEGGEFASAFAVAEFLANPNNIVLTGRDVKSASPFYDSQENQFKVALDLEASGAESFGAATGQAASMSPREVISIWLDDYRVSAPVPEGAITGGSATITGGQGGFTREEAIDLANKINGGALPFALKDESVNIIDPTMGATARDNMILAGIITFAIIAVFMIIRYKILGVVAVLGLTGQLFGMIAIISGFFGAAFLGGSDSFTLTIPGIAGIILSIGMGIDANVITSERIKEEVRSGKTLDGAVQSGYKRAFSAIFDGNITLIIVAFVLMGAFGAPGSFATVMLTPFFFAFGPSAAGTIYAFGFTLIIGAILNFVFGVFTSRLMTYSLIKYKALRKPTFYGGYRDDEHKKRAEGAKIFDAVENRKRFLVAPAVIVAAAIITTFAAGLEVAIEFRGGTMLNYSFDGTIDPAEVERTIEAEGHGKVNVKMGRSTVGAPLDTMTIEFASTEGLTAEVHSGLTNILEEKFADSNLKFSSSQDVSPTMGRAFFLKCLVAVILSFVILMIYIALRFKNIGGWSAGAFAITALLINVTIVFSVFVFFRFPINANFMAVVLTILCYSINDTIVVFDRIRENRTLHGKRLGYKDLVNKSVRQSMTRSMNTTLTTCVAMITISVVAVVAGVGTMLTFAFPLLIGLLAGFVTSLFTVGPFWAAWNLRKADSKK
jgi:SecD/SecF fusion protein